MTEPISRALAVDTHVHVFDPARFPYAAGVGYTPPPHETATAEQLLAVMDAHAISHAVVVNPMAGYQSDNRVTLDAVRRFPDRLAGVAVVEADITADALTALAGAGIVGVRVDLIGRGARYLLDEGRRLPAMLREAGLLLQIQSEKDQLDGDVLAHLRASAGQIVIDHLGRPEPAAGIAQPGFAALLRLADHAGAHLKLSGPFRFSHEDWPHRDADALVAELLRAFGPERCVWGSDWPFIRMPRRIDYGPTLALLDRWVPDASARRAILWDTPARLFRLRASG